MTDSNKRVIAKKAEPAFIKSFIIASNKSDGRTVDLTNGIQQLEYRESIMSETISASIIFIDSGNAIPFEGDDSPTTAVEGLPIVGTENVFCKIEDLNENELDLKLYVNKITPFSEDTRRNVVSLSCVSKEFILNEKLRVNTRFDGKISDHIKKIIQDNENYFGTDKDCSDIEITDNNYNFIGNRKKPFFIINDLSKKAVPQGRLGKSAGFFFFETSDGFHFKSIDTLMDSKKNPIKKSILYDNVPDERGKSLPPEYDVKALEYSEENRTNIKEKFLVGANSTRITIFNEKTQQYDVILGGVTNIGSKSGSNVPQDNGTEESLSLAGDELPVLNREFLRDGVDENYSRSTFYVTDTGTLPEGDSKQQLEKSSDPNFVQSQIVNQSIRRYNQFYTFQVTITIPGDFSLHAGDAIFLDSPSVDSEKKGEVNKRTGGLYIITDLCHHVSVNGTFTKCNLVRDSFGRKGKPIKA